MRNGGGAFGSLVSFVLVLIALIAFRTYEAGEEESLRAINSAGFSEPELGDYDALECGGGKASRAFVATNPRGARVRGVVCCSISGCSKACTLRWP